jgi:hypothetical protein
VLVFELFVLSSFLATIWFYSVNKFGPATRLVLWIFIQHYYLLLNCVPDILTLLPSQAPHVSGFCKYLSFAIVVPLSQGKNQPPIAHSMLCSGKNLVSAW